MYVNKILSNLSFKLYSCIIITMLVKSLKSIQNLLSIHIHPKNVLPIEPRNLVEMAKTTICFRSYRKNR